MIKFALALSTASTVYGTSLQFGIELGNEDQFKKMLNGDNDLWLSLEDEADDEWWWSTDLESQNFMHDDENEWAEGNVKSKGKAGQAETKAEDGDGS